MRFFEELHRQRWDDHRYYHHNRINQCLHLASASCFLASYALIFVRPVAAVMVGWLLAMVLRQAGHFFFEPRSYDAVNQATHDYKESVKVGYNLRRKVVLLSLWAAVPLALWRDPSFFGLLTPRQMRPGWIHNVAVAWLLLGAGAVVFRTLHLFFLLGVQPGLVWFTKILTDPVHDIRIYHRAPLHVLRGEMYDDMSDWYRAPPVVALEPQPEPQG